ncbi:MAG TPA: ATP-binding protein [Mycobacteriales bacterium]|nr:ATP-binding protein [Mycobacteriales bacterium]
MSARKPGPTRRMRLRRLTLRTQVLLLVLGLLAAVSAAVGIATDIALQHFLVGRLDSQLVQAGGRTSGALGFTPRGGPGPSDSGNGGEPALTDALRGQGPGTLVAQVRGGIVTADLSTDTGQITPVDPAQLGGLTQLPLDGRPHSLRVAGLGYRAVGSRAADGDVYVTALPTAGIDATLLRLNAIDAGVTGAALLVAGVAGIFLIRLTLRPLIRVAATARRVTELPLDRGEVALVERVPEPDTDPRTEVGQVGAALNSLLGHVGSALQSRQASESKVRQFVADASHELRTPLAAIRGYAELSRRGPEPLGPHVAHNLRRVESESIRMTSLVEDLLLLARLDAGRPLEAQPVDLSRLLVDAVSDAHAAGLDHVWRLELPDEPVVVTGDVLRLHQVVANLLSNARTHTPPGCIVTARVGPTPAGLAVLTVSDDGPGVPAQLQATIFERFARADSSRSRAAGSTGLGLAIVSAVVQAHGGNVEVTSRPGDTAFVVRLPLAPPSGVDRRLLGTEHASSRGR